MAFWSDVSAQPKLSYQWRATFGGATDGIAIYTLLSFQKPSFEIGVAQYIDINDIKYKPGMLSWNPIEIVVVDPADTDTNNSSKLYNIIKNSGYVNGPGSSAPMSAIVKKEASAAVGSTVLFEQIDADNSTVEEWKLHNPFISKIDYGRGNYAAEEIMTIVLTLVYDYATYEQKL